MHSRFLRFISEKINQDRVVTSSQDDYPSGWINILNGQLLIEEITAVLLLLKSSERVQLANFKNQNIFHRDFDCTFCQNSRGRVATFGCSYKTCV